MDLIADHISHRFGALDVLDDVSFTVASGEVVAIVGPSGCGKSTLLSILGGLLQPSAGAAELRGAPPAGSLNPLTFVFQDFALLPWCTVEANVEFPLAHTALDAAERRAVIDDALRRTGLSDFRGAYPKQLSGGMRQRVGIARALAVRPAILLMDEPLSALDSQTRELLMEDFIRLLADGAMGAVYVTHNLEEAVRLADRIVVLSRRPGRVREVVTIPMTRAERGDDRCARQIAGAAERSVVADPRGGDRRRARGPACLTARRRTRPRRPRVAAGGISRRGFHAERGPLFRLDRARAGDRAVATRRQRRLGQCAVPAAALGDCGRDLQARDVRRALAACVGWSVMRIGSGWMLGTVAGVIVGFAIGLSTLARGVGITFISALFPIPKIALLPLLILWLGIGEEPKIATIALGVFFSTAISVYSGVDAVPRNLIRMAQSFNVPFHAIVRRVIWPGALPSILAGFRITASVALLLVVSAEMIGAQFGIGAFVLQAGNLMQTDQLLAGVVILSLFGLAVGKAINVLEARLLHWR